MIQNSFIIMEKSQKVKLIIGKISKGFNKLMPYMSLIAVVFGIVNLCFLIKIQMDVEDVQDNVENVDYTVRNISMDYDNSDVISAIEDAETNIIGSVEDAESDIKNHIMIWSN